MVNSNKPKLSLGELRYRYSLRGSNDLLDQLVYECEVAEHVSDLFVCRESFGKWMNLELRQARRRWG